jgi:hypothetical protein
MPIIPIDFDDTPDPGVKTLVTKRGVILIYTNPNYKDMPFSF